MINYDMTMIVRDIAEGMKNISCMKNEVGMHEKCYTLFTWAASVSNTVWELIDTSGFMFAC